MGNFRQKRQDFLGSLYVICSCGRGWHTGSESSRILTCLAIEFHTGRYFLPEVILSVKCYLHGYHWEGRLDYSGESWTIEVQVNAAMRIIEESVEEGTLAAESGGRVENWVE